MNALEWATLTYLICSFIGHLVGLAAPVLAPAFTRRDRGAVKRAEAALDRVDATAAAAASPERAAEFILAQGKAVTDASKALVEQQARVAARIALVGSALRTGGAGLALLLFWVLQE